MAKQSYLGYTHDTARGAGARSSAGEVQAAFLMNATQVEQVLEACEAGFVLPQKSTYFQPKLGDRPGDVSDRSDADRRTRLTMPAETAVVSRTSRRAPKTS